MVGRGNKNVKIKRVYLYNVFVGMLIIILLLASVPVSASERGTSRNKISNTLWEEINQTEISEDYAKEIPVYIWYQDINQDEIDIHVEKITGLTRSTLDTTGNVESEINKICGQVDIKTRFSEKTINAYLEETLEDRKRTKDNTDTYVQTRRVKARQEYGKQADEIVKKLELSQEQIVFQSRYAPMLIAKLTCEEIESVAKCTDVEQIELYKEQEIVPESSTQYDFSATVNTAIDHYMNTASYMKDIQKTNLTGKGVSVGIIESDISNTADLLTDMHWELVYSIIHRMAPKAEIRLAGGWRKPEETYKFVEQLIDDGVQILNLSWGGDAGESYSSMDKWYDHVVYQHNIIVVKSAGNLRSDYHSESEWLITSPGLAYNVITVGAVNKNNMLSDSSSYYIRGCKKPDLVAQGYVEMGVSGTSFAAPAVTATVALMLELNPSLSAHPQAVKAILQAGCYNKAVDEEANNKISNSGCELRKWQGAGMLNVLNTLAVVKHKQFGIGYMEGATEDIRFTQPAYGASKMNVTLSWLYESKITHSDVVDEIAEVGIEQDLDLYLYPSLSSQAPIKQSSLSNSSTEMLSIEQLLPDSSYRVRVNRYNSDSTDPIRYAFAWSTNNIADYYDRVPTEIYYIRNKETGLYLDLNGASGTANILQYTFHGGTNQKWIIQKEKGILTMRNNYVYDMGVLGAGPVRDKYSEWATVKPYQNCGLKFYLCYDGAYAIYYENYDSGLYHALGPQVNDAAVGSKIIWRNYAMDDMHWYLEKINYQKGDVNLDGNITQSDLTELNRLFSSSIGLDEGIKRYLADVNGDGVIDSKDRDALNSLI